MLHRRPTRPIVLLVTSLVIAAGVFVLVIAAPWLASHGHPLAAALIYQAFSPLCHQIPSRSFELEGVPFAVCARCTGVYFGLVVGLLIYPLWRRIEDERMPNRIVLAAGIAPLALDGLAGVIGLFSSPMGLRAATGVLAGVVIASFLLPGLVSIALNDDRHRHSRSSRDEVANTLV